MRTALFIVDSLHSPAQNGKELPILRLVEKLRAEKWQVHVAHLGSVSDDLDIAYIPLKTRKARFRDNLHTLKKFGTLDFLSGRVIQPAQVKNKNFDLLWVSPASLNIPALHWVESENLSFKIKGVGLNDVKYSLYRDSLFELLKIRKFQVRKLLHFLKSFAIKYQEKKMLRHFDLVHVQTGKEARKLRSIFEGHITIAPNGLTQVYAKQTAVKDSEPVKILIFSQFNKGRSHELNWFFTDLYPKLEQDRIEVHVVGPNTDKYKGAQYDNVIFHGFVDEFSTMYQQSHFSIVPTFHSTGLLNRIVDSLAHDVPVVTTRSAATTVLSTTQSDLIGIRYSDQLNEIVSWINKLTLDRDELDKLQSEIRHFHNEFPTKEESVDTIYKQISRYVG